MKREDLDIITRIIRETSFEPATVNAPKPNKRSLTEDEAQFRQLRKVFDQKYAVSTPLELMRI